MKQFLHRASEQFSSVSDLVRNELLTLCENVPVSSVDRPDRSKTDLPNACRYLTDALAKPEGHPLLTDLARILPQLHWFEAPPGKLGPSMDGRNTVCQIVGPDSQWHSATLRFGAFLLAPDTDYPTHAHAADEIYLLLSGTGAWSVDGNEYVSYAQGDAIQVTSWQPHAIQSGSQPLLMLWAWTGELSFDHYHLEAGR